MADPMIIFDDGLGELGPMTDLRASFEVRTGMLTTAGRIAARRRETLAGYRVPPRLAGVVAERAGMPVNTLPDAPRVLCVNGRWRMPDPRLRIGRGQALLDPATGLVVAALLPRDDAETFLERGELPDGVDRRTAETPQLYRYPWDVLSMIAEAITADLDAIRMVETKVPTELANVVGHHPVEVHETANVYPTVVLDAGAGPIAVHERAVVRPGAVLCGPCSIGRGSVVVEHALIKPNTAVGPVCKVGGEIGGTIFQGYANKAHDGHLGDSWVGKWVNFGAGTTNSNLLNTYGEIAMRIEPDGPMHRTGLTFQGAIVGDHVKFAIGTRIMTGAVIGTGAMVACTAPPPETVRRFAWLTDRGASVYRLEKFIEAAGRMMIRRDRVPSREYVEVLRALYEEATRRRRRDGAE